MILKRFCTYVFSLHMDSIINLDQKKQISYSAGSEVMKLAVKRKLSLSLITVLMAQGFPHPTIVGEFTFIDLTFILMKNIL